MEQESLTMEELKQTILVLIENNNLIIQSHMDFLARKRSENPTIEKMIARLEGNIEAYNIVLEAIK